MALPVLPPPTVAMVDSSGNITDPWYRYFNQGSDSLSSSLASVSSALSAEVAKGPTGFFHIDRNSTGQTVVAGSSTQIVNFNNEVYDVSLWYDTTTSRYTPLQAGYYHFGCNLFTTSNKNGYSVLPILFKNGAYAYEGSYIFSVSTVGESQGNLAVSIFMNGTTDYIQFGVNSPSTFINGSTRGTYAFGYKVGST